MPIGWISKIKRKKCLGRYWDYSSGWNAIGIRRPSGLCGAALLIAARIHRFNRTVQHVIKEVQVLENAVRKRMPEFCETASSKLTLRELQLVDLEEEHDPPAFLKSRKKSRNVKIDKEVNSIFVSLFRMTLLSWELHVIRLWRRCFNWRKRSTDRFHWVWLRNEDL